MFAEALGLFLERHVAAGSDNANRSTGRAFALELGLTPRAKPAISPASQSNSIVDVVTTITADVRCSLDRIEHGSDIVTVDHRGNPFRAVIQGIGGQVVEFLGARVEVADIRHEIVIPGSHPCRHERQIAAFLGALALRNVVERNRHAGAGTNRSVCTEWKNALEIPAAAGSPYLCFARYARAHHRANSPNERWVVE